MRVRCALVVLALLGASLVVAAPSFALPEPGTAVVVGDPLYEKRCYLYAGVGPVEFWVESNGVTTGGVPTVTGAGSGLQRQWANGLVQDTRANSPVTWAQRCAPSLEPPEVPEVPDPEPLPTPPEPPCQPFPQCEVPPPPCEPSPTCLVPESPPPPCDPFPACAIPQPPPNPCEPFPTCTVPGLPPPPCTPFPKCALDEALGCDTSSLGDCTPCIGDNEPGGFDGCCPATDVACLVGLVPAPPCTPFPMCAVPTPPDICSLAPPACEPPSDPCADVPCDVQYWRDTVLCIRDNAPSGPWQQCTSPPPPLPCEPAPACMVPPPPPPPCTPFPTCAVPPPPEGECGYPVPGLVCGPLNAVIRVWKIVYCALSGNC